MRLNFKKNVALALVLIVCNPLFSQSFQDNKRLIDKHNVILSVGYGVPSALRVYIKYERNDKDLTVNGFGPLTAKLEYCLLKKLTIGFNAFMNTSDVHWMQNAKNANDSLVPYRHGVIVKERGIGMRINYYFKQTKKYNFYAGGGMGAGNINAETYTRAPKQKVYINYTFPISYHFEGTVGARYFFTKNIGLYGEFGLGQSWLVYNYYFIPAAILQLGITAKL